MLRITFTPDQRAAAQAARRDRTLTPLERDRVAMLLLSAEGWRPPAIAQQDKRLLQLSGGADPEETYACTLLQTNTNY